MKYNIVANLFGSIFFILLPALLFPLYLKVLDPDRFGMFSLYFVILIYFKIIDFGASSTFNRYIAQNKNNDFIPDCAVSPAILTRYKGPKKSPKVTAPLKSAFKLYNI